MFESFVIMVREGIEAALVIGIILVVLRRTGRQDLSRPVYAGLGAAVIASIGAALALRSLPLNEEVYEGALYWVSAAFVASMMGWMHLKSKTLRADIEQRVQQAAVTHSAREAWGLGAFAFLMVFREGAETVMFLSAVHLTTDALLSFIGSVLGLIAAVTFAVMFVRGSFQVNLRRFFAVTEWVLGIFVAQLMVNGYHEFSEAGWVPATQRSMAVIGPLMRHNSLFILAIVAIPLLIRLTGRKKPQAAAESAGSVEERLVLARARRERFYARGATVTTMIVLAAVGMVYAREIVPKKLPLPEMLQAEDGRVGAPLSALEDGKLHRFGVAVGGQTVRFLALKTSDGKVRTALDACKICGAFGYIEEKGALVCLNCVAEINPLTVGEAGGCNPIPLESERTASALHVSVAALEKEAHRFAAAAGAMTEVDPVCGMRVNMSEAAAFETVKGKTYYFCSVKCREAFAQGRGR